jgi:hypothetical protein
MSAIQIKVISVETSNVKTQKGGYDVCEVTYKNLSFQDKVEAKKLMSFTHKDVFNTLRSANNGDVLTIQRAKNDKGYWDWVAVGEGGAAEAPAAAKPGASPTPRSSYETAEERANKQVYIVRQSSINAAIETLKTDKKNPSVDEVLSVARQYEDYVFNRVDSPVRSIEAADLADEDIPY